MEKRLVVEVLAGCADDCVAAARAGADRVELNASLEAGGLTPSAGAVRLGKEKSGLRLVAMLRPRPAGFRYSALEFDTMLRDARVLVEAGADGLVFGILLPDGNIDVARCSALMEATGGACKEWVFHRAFDLVPDAFAALEQLISLGFRRVLTKGQANTFEDGEALLLELKKRAAGRIEILVPGVRPHNVRRIVHDDGFDQIHLGRFRPEPDPSNSARPGIFFGSSSKGHEGVYDVLDEAYVRGIIDAARAR